MAGRDHGPKIAIIVLIAIAGCGRLGFDPSMTGDGGIDAGSDGCWAGWRERTVQLGAPARIDELSTSSDEHNPFIASDLRTLYFGRGPSNSRELLVAYRDGPGASFGPPTTVVSLASTSDEGRVTLTADQLTAVFASTRAGGAGGNDLWLATRTTTAVDFGAPGRGLLLQVNTNVDDVDPGLTGDGLILMYVSDIGGGQHILVARRSGIDQPFGAPTQLTELDTLPSPSDPAISWDERVLLFTAGATADANELYYTTRADGSMSFDAPLLLTSVNSTFLERDVAVSADGCEVFFVSARSGNLDLYHASVTP
jgi:Tol biopolymer transport system component